MDNIIDAFTNKMNITCILGGDIIPSYKETLITKYGEDEGNVIFRDTELFWSGYNNLGITNVILEYKIANMLSTLLPVYMLGLVPTRQSYLLSDNMTILPDTEQTFINLVNGCEQAHKKAIEIYYKKGKGDLKYSVDNFIFDDIPSCPKPWYKSVKFS
jgi:hypothetical protein